MGRAELTSVVYEHQGKMDVKLSEASRHTPLTTSMEAGYRGAFRDPKFGLDRGNTVTQDNTRWREVVHAEESRVLGPAITPRAGGSSTLEPSKRPHKVPTESTGLPRSLPTNIGDVRPIHVNVNSLRNTTPARFSCDTLCGNWSEERRDPNAEPAYKSACLAESAVSHIYSSESKVASRGVEESRLPTDPIVNDEADRLQSTQRLAFTDPFHTETNVKTATYEEVFPETDALREYRAKWTSRPFAKQTEHSVAFKNWHKS